VKRPVDEKLQVVGDPLVRVVESTAIELEMVVRSIGEPLADEAVGEPAPPADLQHLLEVGLVDRDHDEDRGENAEVRELVRKMPDVAVLESVVETIVPAGEQHVHVHEAQVHRHDRGEQRARGPAVFRRPVGTSQRVRRAKEPERLDHDAAGTRVAPSAQRRLRGALAQRAVAMLATAT